jgi:hypothetical protein
LIDCARWTGSEPPDREARIRAERAAAGSGIQGTSTHPRAKFHGAPQRWCWPGPSERSAAAELSSSFTVRTRPQPFCVQPLRCAQRSAHGNSLSGVARSASRADASSPLIRPHAITAADSHEVLGRSDVANRLSRALVPRYTASRSTFAIDTICFSSIAAGPCAKSQFLSSQTQLFSIRLTWAFRRAIATIRVVRGIRKAS